jgi:metal-responsive CopG/Arc/MetJ family transcriptional regulator
MPTDKKRVNVTLDSDLAKMIELKSKLDGKSMSQIIVEAVEEQLDLEEELAWSKVAKERREKTKSWHSHDEAWQ